MLLFNEERGEGERRWRVMVALDVMTLLTRMRDRTQPEFLNEIAPSAAPVKLAFDCELKMRDPADLDKAEAVFGTRDPSALTLACREHYERLVTAVIDELGALTGRTLARSRHLAELQATRHGKWSMHLTVDGFEDGRDGDEAHDTIAFESNRDCAEFVRRLIALPSLADCRAGLELIVDKGIYAERHPLRTYYSAKRGAEQHWLRALDAPLDAPCDADFLATSLRTCFRLHAKPPELVFYGQSNWPVYVTSAYLAGQPELLRAPPLRLAERRLVLAPSGPSSLVLPLATQGGSFAGALLLAIARAPEFERFKVRQTAGGVKFLNPYTIVAACRALECSAREEGGAHSDGHECVYLSIDLLRRTYTQLCHSQPCKEQRAIAQPRARALPPAACEAVGAFLCSTEWEPGEPVGADFAASAMGGGQERA